MQNMRAFKSVCPLRNELHLDITTAVKVSVKQCTSCAFLTLTCNEGYLSSPTGSKCNYTSG